MMAPVGFGRRFSGSRLCAPPRRATPCSHGRRRGAPSSRRASAWRACSLARLRLRVAACWPRPGRLARFGLRLGAVRLGAGRAGRWRVGLWRISGMWPTNFTDCYIAPVFPGCGALFGTAKCSRRTSPTSGQKYSSPFPARASPLLEGRGAISEALAGQNAILYGPART